MRRLLGVGWLWVLPVFVSVACTVPLEPDSPAPLVLPADARSLVYGRTTAEVLQNPELREKIRALFAADWTPPSGTPAGLTLGAPGYFERGGPLRMVRIGRSDYIAVTGCAPAACQTRRGLLLILEGGSQLFARLDDGGFSRYYGYGSGDISAETIGYIVESGLGALKSVGDPYPTTGS
jgi:hypothetical protein